MREIDTILTIHRKRGSKGLPLERVSKHLFNPEFFLRAYGKIYRNFGAMTMGSTKETVDGMSVQKVHGIIDLLKQERYRWTPVRRTEIPKPKGGTRPLGIPICRSYCTSSQGGLGFRRGPVAPDRILGHQESERRDQRRRLGFRRAAIVSGVSLIHQGPCGTA